MADHEETGEVLFDQLEFLVWAHCQHLGLGLGVDCTCDDCLRYARVMAILMEPFQEKKCDCGVAQKNGKAQKAGG